MYQCNVYFLCCFMLSRVCTCIHEALSRLHSHNHTPLFSLSRYHHTSLMCFDFFSLLLKKKRKKKNNETQKVFIFFFCFIHSVLVGISVSAVLFFLRAVLLYVAFLRGSNNKHLLLKCINCNKNNNKLKQLQVRGGKRKRRKERKKREEKK